MARTVFGGAGVPSNGPSELPASTTVRGMGARAGGVWPTARCLRKRGPVAGELRRLWRVRITVMGSAVQPPERSLDGLLQQALVRRRIGLAWEALPPERHFGGGRHGDWFSAPAHVLPLEPPGLASNVIRRRSGNVRYAVLRSPSLWSNRGDIFVLTGIWHQPQGIRKGRKFSTRSSGGSAERAGGSSDTTARSTADSTIPSLSRSSKPVVRQHPRCGFGSIQCVVEFDRACVTAPVRHSWVPTHTRT